MPAWPERDVLDLIARALDEDVGPGDITTQACVPVGRMAAGKFLARQELVVAGIELLPLIYERQREQASSEPGRTEFQVRHPSGARVAAGTVIATVSGPARRLLERERVALNFLQHLSGIATLTRRFVDAVEGTGVTILDTRKTTPGWRRLEKQAVAAGGGHNHRFGLYDAVLIKENHIAAAGGIRAAVEAVRHAGEVEVEVRNADELREALDAGACRVLLDNMTPEQVRDCVRLVREGAAGSGRAGMPVPTSFGPGRAGMPVPTSLGPGRAGMPVPTSSDRAARALVEVSGGVTLANVREYALAGPDFISVGALTHSAPAADISFLLEDVRG